MYKKSNRSRKKSGKLKGQLIRVLLDLGTTGNIIKEKVLYHSKISKGAPITWSTFGGKLKITKEAKKISFQLIEFSTSKEIDLDFQIILKQMNKDFPYNIIIGNVILANLGMILDFKSRLIIWDSIEVSIKGINYYDSKDKMFETFIEIKEPEEVQQASKRVNNILYATYKKAYLPNIIS